MNELVMCKGMPVQSDSSWGFWRGEIVVPVETVKEEALTIDWTGAPIPPDLFRQILGFFKWTYDTHDCESQVRLYYHPTDETWVAVVMPQFIIRGLSSKEDDADPEFSKIQVQMAKLGFGHMGSAHHHCGIDAFQSGTDEDDEEVVEGFHYTIGYLGQDVADFHARCVVRKIIYDTDALQFVPYINNHILSLKNLPVPNEVWQSRMTSKPVPATVHNGGNRGRHAWGHFQGDYSGSQHWLNKSPKAKGLDKLKGLEEITRRLHQDNASQTVAVCPEIGMAFGEDYQKDDACYFCPKSGDCYSAHIFPSDDDDGGDGVPHKLQAEISRFCLTWGEETQLNKLMACLAECGSDIQEYSPDVYRALAAHVDFVATDVQFGELTEGDYL